MGRPQLAEHDGLAEVAGDHQGGLFDGEHRIVGDDLFAMCQPGRAREAEHRVVEDLGLLGEQRVPARLQNDRSDDPTTLEVEVDERCDLITDHSLEVATDATARIEQLFELLGDVAVDTVSQMLEQGVLGFDAAVERAHRAFGSLAQLAHGDFFKGLVLQRRLESIHDASQRFAASLLAGNSELWNNAGHQLESECSFGFSAVRLEKQTMRALRRRGAKFAPAFRQGQPYVFGVFTAPRDAPWPDDWTVEAARDAYLQENGFTVAAYSDPTTAVSLLGFTFHIPNTAPHKRAIMWHDLHHVVTGFGTNPTGEGEISAWELRRGLAGLDLYVGAIVVGLVALGLVVSPRRTIRAWRESGAQKGSLFPSTYNYDDVLKLRVGELRTMLGVGATGVAAHERELHSGAPARP